MNRLTQLVITTEQNLPCKLIGVFQPVFKISPTHKFVLLISIFKRIWQIIDCIAVN